MFPPLEAPNSTGKDPDEFEVRLFLATVLFWAVVGPWVPKPVGGGAVAAAWSVLVVGVVVVEGLDPAMMPAAWVGAGAVEAAGIVPVVGAVVIEGFEPAMMLAAWLTCVAAVFPRMICNFSWSESLITDGFTYGMAVGT